MARDERDERDEHPGHREVLTMSALGVSALLLPSATAAASLDGRSLDEDTEVSYVSGDAPLASWRTFVISSRTDYEVEAEKTGSRRTALIADTGTDQRPNPNAYVGAGTVTAGKIGFDDEFSRDWRVLNDPSTTGFDLTASPYVEYRLRTVSNRSVAVRSFVLHSTRAAQEGLSLRFYSSTDGFATSTLRRIASHSLENRKIVVDLTGTITGGVTIAGGQTLAVRMYVFTGAAANNVFVDPRNDGGVQPRTGLTAADTAQSAFESPSLIGLPEGAASFIGQEAFV